MRRGQLGRPVRTVEGIAGADAAVVGVGPASVLPCPSVMTYGRVGLAIRYTCTRPEGHEGLHEHRPRPERMAVAEWR